VSDKVQPTDVRDARPDETNQDAEQLAFEEATADMTPEQMVEAIVKLARMPETTDEDDDDKDEDDEEDEDEDSEDDED
jgi:hypothetical protein